MTAIVAEKSNKKNSSESTKSTHKVDTVKQQQKPKTKIIQVNEELKHATSPIKHQLWTRAVIAIAVTILAYFYSKNRVKETQFALVTETLPFRMQKFPCAASYAAEIQAFPQCVPKKCGRFVSDKLVEIGEAEILLDLAQRIIPKAGSSGGASILDIHTGALSYKEQFINVYTVKQLTALIEKQHLTVYNLVKGKIRLAIAEQFGIPASTLYLTYPTFFSRLSNVTAKAPNDEYWHEHVDKETYPSFHYTSLLYLTNYKEHFNGGRFIFVDGVDKNRTTSNVEPKMGRVSAFTSGSENRHYVEQVTDGERYAITISFTCDEKLAISDPQLKIQE